MATAVSANKAELIAIADAVAREKLIDKAIVIEAMEDAIQRAARARYGAENDIRAKLDPNTGGTATLDMNAGATVYGAVVVQGQINKANGTAAIVFNGDVFKNFSNSIPASTSNLPGAWTDRLSY